MYIQQSQLRERDEKRKVIGSWRWFVETPTVARSLAGGEGGESTLESGISGSKNQI